jgi:hypothetical protein
MALTSSGASATGFMLAEAVCSWQPQSDKVPAKRARKMQTVIDHAPALELRGSIFIIQLLSFGQKTSN